MYGMYVRLQWFLMTLVRGFEGRSEMLARLVVR
jgi:hypothetical protein